MSESETITIRFPSQSTILEPHARTFTSGYKTDAIDESTLTRPETIRAQLFVSYTAPVSAKPVKVEGNRLTIDVENMVPGVFYYFEFEGIPQLVTRTSDGKLEFYEIVDKPEK